VLFHFKSFDLMNEQAKINPCVLNAFKSFQGLKARIGTGKFWTTAPNFTQNST